MGRSEVGFRWLGAVHRVGAVRGFGAFLVSLAVSCGSSDQGEVGRQSARVVAPLPAAYCEVTVDGTGTIDLEEDYLPRVILCENGGANLEALKAQAVAARSVAYYHMARDGSICDSQSCQVFGCSATPSAKHYQAVQETSGLYLAYDDLLTFGFYVDGDHDTAPPTCIGAPSAPREHFITYNEGKSGAEVSMTTLGFIPSGQDVYGQNRGCMSQWGARCLENELGYGWESILRFYYGADVEILQAPGDCVTPVDRPAEGELSSADCEQLSGWAWDPDTPGTALEVEITIDGAPATMAPIVLTADEPRDELCTSLGSCDHGFSLSPIPSELLDGKSYTVRAHIREGGTVAEELEGGPVQLSCSSAGAGGTPGAGGASGAENVGGASGAGVQPAGGPASRVVGGESGCSCRTSDGAPGGLALGSLFGLLLVGRRRRNSKGLKALAKVK